MEMSCQDFGDKVAKVRSAAKSFGEDKDCAFEAKASSAAVTARPSQIELISFLPITDDRRPNPSACLSADARV